MAVDVQISIPDTLVNALGVAPQELPKTALSALIVQAYRRGQTSHADVGGLVGLNRFETDKFLKDAEAFHPFENAEFVSDLALLRSLAKDGCSS